MYTVYILHYLAYFIGVITGDQQLDLLTLDPELMRYLQRLRVLFRLSRLFVMT